MTARLLSSPRAGLIMAAVAVGVALAVGGGIAAQSSTTTAAPALPWTTHPCQADQLRAFVAFSASRPAAHGTYVPVDFINLWKQECRLRGYTEVTGVSTTAGDDAHAAHIRAAVTSVLLPKGYTAHTWLLIANASGGTHPAGGAAGCKQLTASGLRVFLPNASGHIWIPWPFTACAGTGQSLLSVRPVLRGLANPTSFP